MNIMRKKIIKNRFSCRKRQEKRRVGSYFPLKFKIRCFIWNFEKSQALFESLNDFELFVQCSSETAEFCWRGAESYSPPLKCFALDEFSFESFELVPHFTVFVKIFCTWTISWTEKYCGKIYFFTFTPILTVLFNEPTPQKINAVL